MYSEEYSEKVEGGLSSKRYTNSVSCVFTVFSKGRLKFCDVFKHSVIKKHNICTTQLVSSILFECLFPSNSLKNSQKELKRVY